MAEEDADLYDSAWNAQIKPHYTCGLCETILDEKTNIVNHECNRSYPYFYIDDNYYFYPVSEDKRMHRKSQMPNGQEKVMQVYADQENDQNFNNNNIDPTRRISTNDDLFVEKLIECVHEREALWNIKGIRASKRGYYDKQKLWEEISSLFSDKPPVAFLKSKWKNLCTQYQRAAKKLRGKSGQAAQNTVKWPYFDMMSFMKDVDLNSQETASNIMQDCQDISMDNNESLASLSNFQDIPPIEEVLGDEDLDSGMDVPVSNRKRQKKQPNFQLQAAETLANAIQASTPVIQFPPIPAIPPPPPPTEAGAFALLIETKLNSITHNDDRDEVMQNMFTFLTSEVKRVRECRERNGN